MHDILRWLGILDPTSAYYAFWSGFGSDISEFAMFGLLITLYKRHNCEVKSCHRIARHVTPEGHAICMRHNPEGHITHQHLLNLHKKRNPPA